MIITHFGSFVKTIFLEVGTGLEPALPLGKPLSRRWRYQITLYPTMFGPGGIRTPSVHLKGYVVYRHATSPISRTGPIGSQLYHGSKKNQGLTFSARLDIMLVVEAIVMPDKIFVDRDLIEELYEWLSAPQTTGGSFPMETHRAESEGVDHLLSGLHEALYPLKRIEPACRPARQLEEPVSYTHLTLPTN